MRAILDESDIASLVAEYFGDALTNTGNELSFRFFVDKNGMHCLELWTTQEDGSLTYKPDPESDNEDEPDLDNA